MRVNKGRQGSLSPTILMRGGWCQGITADFTMEVVPGEGPGPQLLSILLGQVWEQTYWALGSLDLGASCSQELPGESKMPVPADPKAHGMLQSHLLQGGCHGDTLLEKGMPQIPAGLLFKQLRVSSQDHFCLILSLASHLLIKDYLGLVFHSATNWPEKMDTQC